MKKIEVYTTDAGKEPFTEWLQKQDPAIRIYIDKYISRVAKSGSKSNIRNLGNGIFEIKMPKGPGYRVYFGEIKNVIILLLLAGDKGSQNQDILKAKEYWRNHNV